MSRKTRKLIWSAPLVAVFAVVGALALFMALSAQWGAGRRCAGRGDRPDRHRRRTFNHRLELDRSQ